MLEDCAQKKEPLPDYEETRRRLAAGQALNPKMTVAEWLDIWLTGKKRLRKGGHSRYEPDIRVHLKPHLGEVCLDKLSIPHLDRMFDSINDKNIEIQEQNGQRRAAVQELEEIPWKGAENRARRTWMKASIEQMPPYLRVTSVSAQQHIKATIRAALNTAIAQRVIPNYNPAEHIELQPGTKPKALIWITERIARWRETGNKPSPVMVWKPEQTGQFLDHISGTRLEMMWRLIAFRGLRRGEACGPRWVDHAYKNAALDIATQLVQDGWEVVEGAPKTNSGVRTVALDAETNEGLKTHKEHQETAKREWGLAWQETGRIFTEEDGSLLHPGKVSDRFDRLVAEAGLPPIRPHDLRHGAATLMLAAGVDIKVVSDTLGHSDSRITRDVYQSVLDDLARAAAEAVVKLVPRAPGAVLSATEKQVEEASPPVGAAPECTCTCTCGAAEQGALTA